MLNLLQDPLIGTGTNAFEKWRKIILAWWPLVRVAASLWLFDELCLTIASYSKTVLTIGKDIVIVQIFQTVTGYEMFQMFYNADMWRKRVCNNWHHIKFIFAYCSHVFVLPVQSYFFESQAFIDDYSKEWWNLTLTFFSVLADIIS